MHIVSRVFFAQICRCHVYGDTLSRKFITAFRVSCRNTVVTFFNGIIGQSYEMIANARMNVNFYGDALRINAKDGTAKNLSKYK